MNLLNMSGKIINKAVKFFVKSFVYLRISGLGLNIQEITDQLKIAPDRAYKKGDVFVDQKRGAEKVIYQEDCWITGYELNEDMKLEEEIECFVRKFKNSSAYLKTLAEKHNVTIWVSVYPDTEQANIHISLPTISIASEMGATLDCSVAFLKEFYSGIYER